MSISQNYPEIAPSLDLSFALTKKLDPRVTFARASSATYYGTQTAKAEENLLTFSQEFNNSAWTKIDGAVTANTSSAPDGSTTADLFAITTASGNASVRRDGISIVSGQVYVASTHLKYTNNQWVRIRIPAGMSGTPSAYFDIQNGVVGTVGAGLTASITAMADGYYRCVVIFTSNATSGSVFFYPVDADNSASQTIGAEMTLWGAQLEQR